MRDRQRNELIRRARALGADLPDCELVQQFVRLLQLRHHALLHAHLAQLLRRLCHIGC